MVFFVVLSGSTCVRESKKASLFLCCSSDVKLIRSCWLLRCSRNESTYIIFSLANVSSTYLLQNEGGDVNVARAFFSNFSTLYPSVPQEEAIDIFHQLMINDDNLASKTSVSAENVTALFKICVRTTYFAFNKKLYQQIDGLAIGASSSGFAAELFMEMVLMVLMVLNNSTLSFTLGNISKDIMQEN